MRRSAERGVDVRGDDERPDGTLAPRRGPGVALLRRRRENAARPISFPRTAVVDPEEGAFANVDVEAYEHVDGTLIPTVELPSDAKLYTWQQANQVIEAIRSAATTAFGPSPSDEQADMDEYDAATAELVERASNPTDVNRLVAAAIRFRSAYLGA